MRLALRRVARPAAAIDRGCGRRRARVHDGGRVAVGASPRSPPPIPELGRGYDAHDGSHRARDASTSANASEDDAFPLSADGRAQLKGMRRSELARWLEATGERAARADGLFATMYRDLSTNAFEGDGRFGEKFASRLERVATMDGDLRLGEVRRASDGTRKVTYALADDSGGIVESVLIPSGRRTTVCVSSQLGCAMNCQFCFTATMGLRKNLSAAQIVEQVVRARRMCDEGEEVSNVVFMGMGEPLHNIDEVLKAVDILLDPRGLAFSRNKVTVSTSGLVPQMERFLSESEASLAVSLNATTDYIRNWIMPINRKYNLDSLLGLLRREFPRTDLGRHQRQVFFEYIMLAGVNDSDEDADRLIEIAKSLPCKINLIYFNTHDGAEFKCSDQERIAAFRQRVSDAGVTCTIRVSRGDEEMSACGQLGSPGDFANWKPPPPRMRDPRTRAARA